MKYLFSHRGFTLVEVLVTIAIIGILSSVLYVSFNDARENSRTKAIQSELKEVQLALELYRAQFDQYPAVPGCGSAGTGDHFANTNTTGTGACGTADYISAIVPDFIAEIPRATDSANTNCVIEYRTNSTGDWYKLTASECIAGEQQLTIDDELARCPSTCSQGSTPPGCAGQTMNATYLASDAFTKSFSVYSFGYGPDNHECK